DSDGRRSRVYLSAAPEIGVSETTSLTEARPAPSTQQHPPHLRINGEQASYAYSPRKKAAPLFTLEATTFQARERELVAILGPNASGKSTLLRLIAGAIAP